MQSNEGHKNRIETLFKTEYGKLVSVLVKVLGANNIDLAEDVVQEAMIEAFNKWGEKTTPENAVGWLYAVAKNKAVNVINKEVNRKKYTSDVAELLQSDWTAAPALEFIFSDKEIADDQLSMMFTCCHPILSHDSQIALTLKTLCGFSVLEIAKAFVSSESSINKRLVRARKTIKDKQIPFEIPHGEELQARTDAVLESIYLLFNEGYSATEGDRNIKFELCSEAIRLVHLLVGHKSIHHQSNILALLSLMYFNSSRFQSRLRGNVLIEMEQQDMSLWDQSLIHKGLTCLDAASKELDISKYHLLATISGHYSTAKDFQSIDWNNILLLYDQLITIDGSPTIALNRAMVYSKIHGADRALIEIEKIENQSVFSTYSPYYTVSAELYILSGKVQSGIERLEKALTLPMDENSRQSITEKLKRIRGCVS